MLFQACETLVFHGVDFTLADKNVFGTTLNASKRTVPIARLLARVLHSLVTGPAHVVADLARQGGFGSKAGDCACQKKYQDPKGRSSHCHPPQLSSLNVNLDSRVSATNSYGVRKLASP